MESECASAPLSKFQEHALRAVLDSERGKMDTPKTADIVIIGGGVMGASAAYHLAQRGINNVVLLEKEEFFGTGATGRCAGGVRYQFSTEINVKLSLESLPMIERFKEEIGQDVAGIGQKGERTGEPAAERFDEREPGGQCQRDSEGAAGSVAVGTAQARRMGMVVPVAIRWAIAMAGMRRRRRVLRMAEVHNRRIGIRIA
jgi:glycine/D-amino acid oxidase-like deaminating enzyme